MTTAPVGTHCILELHGCSAEKLNDLQFVRDAVRTASGHGLSTLLKLISHQFEPQGVTAIGLLAESHVSIHTWPETGYAAVDMFTCGETADPQRACAYMATAFEADRYELKTVARGGVPDPDRVILRDCAEGLHADGAFCSEDVPRSEEDVPRSTEDMPRSEEICSDHRFDEEPVLCRVRN